MKAGISRALADSCTSVCARLRRVASRRALSTHQVAARRYEGIWARKNFRAAALRASIPAYGALSSRGRRETRRGHAALRGEGARPAGVVDPTVTQALVHRLGPGMLGLPEDFL